MKKQFYSFEELQKKKQRAKDIFIGIYTVVVMAIIAAIVYFMGR